MQFRLIIHLQWEICFLNNFKYILCIYFVPKEQLVWLYISVFAEICTYTILHSFACAVCLIYYNGVILCKHIAHMATLFSESNNIILKAIMRTKSTYEQNTTNWVNQVWNYFGVRCLNQFSFYFRKELYYYEMKSLFLEVSLMSKANSRAVASIWFLRSSGWDGINTFFYNSKMKKMGSVTALGNMQQS